MSARLHEGRARQMVLDLAQKPSFDPDQFLVSPCNAQAHAALVAWPNWPDRVLLIVGPPGSGKSHLAAIWAGRAEARRLTGTGCIEAADIPTGGAAGILEDCDRVLADERTLFHLLNLVRDEGGWLVLTARVPPVFWNLRTPDLLSRLRLAPTVTIDRPDLVLIKSVIVKLFADRQITVDDDVVAYAARHCEQSLEAASRFVAAVDEESLAAGRRITRPLAAQILGHDLTCNN